ncbi:MULTISPECIES: DUF1990 family protein [Nocardioides]|uniref:DUF1990 family protein n=1 Tax=Nocardioides vastitatis TaxID=2568655 RepID=A0ABW0ZDH8_9ACTN|nr:DUF1990 domain-containing protein [Nocardioides sp.]THJ15081.1 DUF1990 domain-containing protein [Nocardioides sp.]
MSAEATDDLSYDAVGQTRIDRDDWDGCPRGYRRFERTVDIGQGPEDWERSSADVLRWAVKLRSGFDVRDGAAGLEVVENRGYELVARLGPLRLREPVRVVEVVRSPDRCGFAYGTRTGHPVSGEEAFIVHRSPDGTVRLTLRSLTRAAAGWRRVLFPIALVAQRLYRRRYLRALTRGR